MTPFVVLTMARSGSHHLRYLLNLHPQVKMRGELINATFETVTDADIVAGGFKVAHHMRGRVRAVGFTLFCEQIAGRPFTLTRLLTVPNMHVIVLERVHQLERLRSKAQAIAVDYWAVDKPPGVLPAVTLDFFDTLYWLQVARAYHNQLRGIPNHLWMTYEELTGDRDAALERVWTYLGVDPFTPPPHVSYRQEDRTLAETVTNLDELQAWLTGYTPHP